MSAYALSELIADVVAVLDACGVDRASVVGHDIGAVLAWSLAASVPARLERVMGMAVGFPCGGFDDLDLDQWQHWWYMLLFQEHGVAEDLLPRHDWRVLRAMLADHPDPDAVCRSLEPADALTASIAWYRANVPPRQWRRSGCPRHHSCVSRPAASGRRRTRCSAASRWRGPRTTAVLGGDSWTLEGAGHWFPLTHPDDTLAILEDFLTAAERVGDHGIS